MKKVVLQVPDSVDMDEKEIAYMLAAQLYDKGKLSLGQSAELVGLSKPEFMDILGIYGISIFGETTEDIKHDLGRA